MNNEIFQEYFILSILVEETLKKNKNNNVNDEMNLEIYGAQILAIPAWELISNGFIAKVVPTRIFYCTFNIYI